ncbi:transcriptional regulator [Methanotorris formicicus]|nr:transcriptional regulator [Methanotorris formicicus]
MREMLLTECINLLKTHNFNISQPLGRACFDIIANRGDVRLLIKILKNIDSLSEEQSKELIKIANILSAVPIIIGIRTRNAMMEHGVVYDRYNIKAVTYETFEEYLKGSPPVVYAHRGGFFVKIDGEALKKVRERLNVSVGELAEASGVSRKTIYKYEQNKANPSLEVAIRIEEYLDAPLAEGIDLFEPVGIQKLDMTQDRHSDTKRDVDDYKKQALNILDELGFNLIPTLRAPFDAVAEKHKNPEEKHNILLTNIGERENEDMRRRAILVREMSKLLDGYSLLILEKKERHYKNLAVISMRELEKMDDALDLIEFIKDMLKPRGLKKSI